MSWVKTRKLQLKSCYILKKILRIETQNMDTNREDCWTLSSYIKPNKEIVLALVLREGESIKETIYVKVRLNIKPIA